MKRTFHKALFFFLVTFSFIEANLTYFLGFLI